MTGALRRSLRAGLSAGALLALTVFGTAPVAAQELARIETLSRDGRIDEARAALVAWTEGSWSGASRTERQEALWYRGVLTLDPNQAARQFRRLAVEYPGGAWTARALLRLGRIALLDDAVLEAARWFEDLRRDYPASAARLEAVEWLDANEGRIDARRAQVEAEAESEPPVPTPPPVRPRVAPAPTPVVDSVPEVEEAVDSVRVDPDARWAVQLGAFSDMDRARTLAQEIRATGFIPRLVRIEGSGLVRVRVGSFAGAGTADAMYDRVVAAGFDAAVVNDVAREEPIG